MDADQLPRWPSDRAIAAAVSSLAIVGGAFAVGLVLWDSFGVMTAPISIAIGLVFVRLIKPVQRSAAAPIGAHTRRRAEDPDAAPERDWDGGPDPSLRRGGAG